MNEYPKICSLWKREGYNATERKVDKASKARFIESEYACEEFKNIKRWHVQEKIDGMNIRLIFAKCAGELQKPQIYGRTSNSHLPVPLFSYLDDLATWEWFSKAFAGLLEKDKFNVIFYGEGIGPKIQEPCGSYYRSSPSFVLFDIKVNEWWLTFEDVQEIGSAKLGIDVPPFIGYLTEEEAVEFVKGKPLSRFSNVPQVMEGVICTPNPLMLFRNHNPVKFKLKVRDFI